MPYVLNSGSLSLWSPDPKNRKGSRAVYTAWGNNVIPTLTKTQQVKYASRVTYVDDLPEKSAILDPTVAATVAKMDGGEAVSFISGVDSVETLQDVAKVDTRKSTLAAVTKRLKELGG